MLPNNKDAPGVRDLKTGEEVCPDDAADTAALDYAAQSLIGQRLKAVYGEIVRQPIPDELIKLLDDLERKEQS